MTGQNYKDNIIDPYSTTHALKVQSKVNQKFGKSSQRIITYFGTSQNGKLTSVKCGFSGRLESVKDKYLSIHYVAESLINSKNSVSYDPSFLKGNKRNVRWGKMGANAMNAGRFADPEIAQQNDIVKFYKELYAEDTTKATNFRRSRRENWRRSITNLMNDGQLDEAKRYQSHANLVLSEFHDFIKLHNTKIRRFNPINEIE